VVFNCNWNHIPRINAILVLVVATFNFFNKYSYYYYIGGHMQKKQSNRLFRMLLFSGMLLLSLSGCIRKYDVKFDMIAPEQLAQSATNYQ
jgi:hypothetical protein